MKTRKYDKGQLEEFRCWHSLRYVELIEVLAPGAVHLQSLTRDR